MKTDTDVINYIAALAKLKFSNDEAEKFAEEFQQIMMHFNNLDTVDLSSVDMNGLDQLQPFLREDVLKIFKNEAELFSNVRDFKDNYILTPKVIE